MNIFSKTAEEKKSSDFEVMGKLSIPSLKDNSSKNSNYQNLLELLDRFRVKKSTVGKSKIDGLDIETRFVLITPQLAKLIVEKYNRGNRPVSKPNLRKLTKEMEEGNWIFNGDTITFDNKGVQRNGQHRLLSCIDSNTPIYCLVVTGVQPESFMSMDMGKKRSGGDILSIEGVKNHSNACATLKTIYNFKNNRYGINISSQPLSLSNTEMMTFYNSLNGIEESITYGVKMAKRDECLMAPSLVSTFHYLLGEVDKEKSMIFMDKLCLGYNIEEGSPIQSLRSKITKEKTDKNYKITRSELMANIVYAWNKFKNGKKCKNLRLPENFNMEL
jgi:hypothetical protein